MNVVHVRKASLRLYGIEPVDVTFRIYHNSHYMLRTTDQYGTDWMGGSYPTLEAAMAEADRIEKRYGSWD